MEKAVQQSLLSKASADSKYESNINMLNKQLIKLRPNATKLQVEDVKAESRQGDCLFAAIIIIMQYKARCSDISGMEQHHACLKSVKSFRRAVMQWVQENLAIVTPWYSAAKNPTFVESIGQRRWGGDLDSLWRKPSSNATSISFQWKGTDPSWFCQYLRVQIPQLMLLARRQEADRSSQHGDQPPPPLFCGIHLA